MLFLNYLSLVLASVASLFFFLSLPDRALCLSVHQTISRSVQCYHDSHCRYLRWLANDKRCPKASMPAACDAADGDGGGDDTAQGNTIGIVWFKHSDLRLEDHEPLTLAHRSGSHVAHVFCLDERWFGRTR